MEYNRFPFNYEPNGIPFFNFLSNWMEYDSFSVNYELNGISFSFKLNGVPVC